MISSVLAVMFSANIGASSAILSVTFSAVSFTASTAFVAVALIVFVFGVLLFFIITSPLTFLQPDYFIINL